MPAASWYAEYFGEDYFRIYEPVLAPDRSAREAVQVAERLALPPGAAILEL
jgi:hypothetical protein